jgi:hypothetical protein
MGVLVNPYIYFTPPTGPGTAFTVLHFDGADTSTTITDSTGRHTWTASGDAQIDTAQSKFGGASLLLDGTGDYISAPNSADWDMFKDLLYSYTISVFFRPGSTTSGRVFNQWIDGDNQLFLGVSSGQLQAGMLNAATYDPAYLGSTISTNTWYHVAMVKKGAEYGLYLDGTQVDYSNTFSARSFTSPLYIGSLNGLSGYFTGHIDDFFITNGDYFSASPDSGLTDTITVPTGPYEVAYGGGVPVSNAKTLLNFNGTSGSTTFTDDTSNHTYTANGNAQITTTGPKFGTGAGSFDGSGDYLTAPDSSDWDMFGSTSGDYSLAFWFNPSALTTNHIPVCHYEDDNNEWYAQTGNTTIRGRADESGSASLNLSWVHSGAITTGTWYHFLWAKVGSDVGIYIDGDQKDYASLSTVVTVTGLLYIGRLGTITSVDFAGKLDSLVIASSNIHSVSPNSGKTDSFTVPTGPYTANYGGLDSNVSVLLHMNEVASSEFEDSSTNGNDAATNGDATVSTTTKKLGAGSAALDGTGDYLSVAASSDFDLGTGDFTIDWWEYRTTTAGNECSFKIGDGSPSSGGYSPIMVIDNNGALKVYASDSQSSWDILSAFSFGTITTGQWDHYCIVRDGTSFYIYKNGVYINTTTDAGDFTEAGKNTLLIGVHSSSYMDGYIDEFRISKGVARINDSGDPLYISSGTPSDGFTPPTQEYS